MQVYQFIMNMETMLTIEFKFNAFGMFDGMSLLDMHTYMDMVEHQLEKQSKRFQNGKQLATQLHALKIVLNSMDV